MRKSFIQYLQEADKKTTGLYLGRFQPLHIGHLETIKFMAKNHTLSYVILVKGKDSSTKKDKNPFSLDTQLELVKAVLPQNVKLVIAKNGFVPDIIKDEKLLGFHFVLYCGKDREQEYKRYINYMEEDKTLEIRVLNFNREGVSATKVRDALKNNDVTQFKKLVPRELHHKYDALYKEIMS